MHINHIIKYDSVNIISNRKLQIYDKDKETNLRISKIKFEFEFEYVDIYNDKNLIDYNDSGYEIPYFHIVFLYNIIEYFTIWN